MNVAIAKPHNYNYSFSINTFLLKLYGLLLEGFYLKTQSRLICCDVELNSFYPGITHRGYNFTEVRSTASVLKVPVSCHELMHNWATGDK